MRSLLILSFILAFSIQLSSAQQFDKSVISIFHEQLSDGSVNFFAKNLGHCPISVSLTFSQLQNLRANIALPYREVIEAGETKLLLFSLNPEPNTRTSMRYNYNYCLGDYLKSKPDFKYFYQLPFEINQAFKVGQGYLGKFSHQTAYALDFDMPEGTKVCAAREGIVVAIKQDSNRGGKTKSFADDGNYVYIYHSDGTFGVYYHFKQNGVLVKPGQEVKRGEIIGLSGNTGWSTAPHLHFEVYKPNLPEKKTIPVKFMIADKKIAELKEGQVYKAFETTK